MAKKLIKSTNVVLVEDQIVSDAEKSDESQSSAKIYFILTSVSPPTVHDDHEGAGEDNNDAPAEPIEQAHLKPPTPSIEPELRRSTREQRPSTRYLPYEYVMLTDGELECFKEAMSHQHKNKWIIAMQEEMKSLNENHTYDLVKLPKGNKAIKKK